MNFHDLVKTRYSVRAYKPDPVEDEKLARILEAVRLAPTANNRQPFCVTVIRTQEHEAALKRVYAREWFTQAPLILAVSFVPVEGWVRKTDGWNASVVDATIAMTHLVLAAAEEGLGTCWIAAFDPQAARELLKSSANEIPCSFTPLGYAADSPGLKTRRPLKELVRYLRNSTGA